MIDLNSEQTMDLWDITRSNVPYQGRIEFLGARHGYYVTDQLFKRDSVKLDGGTIIEHPVMLTTSGSAKMILPNENRTYSAKDVMAMLQMPWRQANAHYMVTEQEVFRNYSGLDGDREDTGAGRLVSLLAIRRNDAELDLSGMLEELFPLCPTSASDVRNPHGMRYYITPRTSAQVSAGLTGHIGANPVYGDGNTAASCAGIDTSTAKYANYRNAAYGWSATGVELTEDDIDIIIGAMLDTKFKSPMIASDVHENRYDNFVNFTNRAMYLAFSRKARMNNDDLGADVGKFAGIVRIKGNPIIHMEDLDSDTTNPLFGVNLDTFKPFIQKGNNFREGRRVSDWTQPDTWAHNIDLGFNFMCTNRKLNYIVSNVA